MVVSDVSVIPRTIITNLTRLSSVSLFLSNKAVRLNFMLKRFCGFGYLCVFNGLALFYRGTVKSSREDREVKKTKELFVSYPCVFVFDQLHSRMYSARSGTLLLLSFIDYTPMNLLLCGCCR